MSLKIGDDVYVKVEPCTDLPIEYEPASALAANTWQDVKVEWDNETCGESDVAASARLYTECDEDERAQSFVGLVKAEEQSESACLSEDEGQYIKKEVKEEELGHTVFLQPTVTLACQESSQDNGTKKPDTEPVSSGVLGHKKTRDEKIPFKCGYCTYTTRYRFNYTRHKRQHIHDPKIGDLIRHKENFTEVKSFKCTYCSYSSIRKSCLKAHETIHAGDKPFKCTHCSYSCIHKSSLKRHETIHTGDKPYKCAYCAYSFVLKSDVNRHERTHTEDKPFKCTHCSYSCARKSGLEIHERTHTGDKPYKCAYCTYSCAQKCYLKIHEKFHTEDKPFKCTHCSYSCARKSRLKEHERIHTGH